MRGGGVSGNSKAYLNKGFITRDARIINEDLAKVLLNLTKNPHALSSALHKAKLKAIELAKASPAIARAISYTEGVNTLADESLDKLDVLALDADASHASTDASKNLTLDSKELSASANKDESDVVRVDLGFRVLKLDSSNYLDRYYRVGDYTPSLLDELEDVIKSDRSSLDLLFQVMLNLGIELTADIKSETFFDGNALQNEDEDTLHRLGIPYLKVFKVNHGSLALLAEGTLFSENLIEMLLMNNVDVLVVRESVVESDDKITAIDKVVKEVSPKTRVMQI